MGLREWLGDPFGVKAMAQQLAAERRSQNELVAQVLRTSEEQAMAVARMVGVLERAYAALEHDGSAPEGRHLSEEQEADMFEQWDEAARNGR